jgi:hypothetical protein
VERRDKLRWFCVPPSLELDHAIQSGVEWVLEPQTAGRGEKLGGGR